MNLNTKNYEILGGKISLGESAVTLAEVAALKKFSEKVKNLIPINSTEKAKNYRAVTLEFYAEMDAADPKSPGQRVKRFKKILSSLGLEI